MEVTREEFDALAKQVKELKEIIEQQQRDASALWAETSRARLNTMVFGPGDNDYGRNQHWPEQFARAVIEACDKTEELQARPKE